MPASDSLLLYVGVEEKIFEKYGLNVEIIPFQSAIELGAAMRSGAIDGYFTCIINAALQHLSGTPQQSSPLLLTPVRPKGISPWLFPLKKHFKLGRTAGKICCNRKRYHCRFFVDAVFNKQKFE